MGETIHLSEDVVETLRDRKGPEESYEDVIRELLEASESGDADREAGVAGRPDPAIETDDEITRLVNEVAAESLPDTGASVERRREALQAVVEHLREHETADRAGFERDVYPKHPVGASGEENPERTWWEAMSEGLAVLAERSEAIERGDSGEWRYGDGRGE